ncbi:MAG: hypothetical protein ACI9QC_000150 [Oceanicoccus sp.]|jgi:hypothetical protein
MTSSEPSFQDFLTPIESSAVFDLAGLGPKEIRSLGLNITDLKISSTRTLLVRAVAAILTRNPGAECEVLQLRNRSIRDVSSHSMGQAYTDQQTGERRLDETINFVNSDLSSLSHWRLDLSTDQELGLNAFTLLPNGIRIVHKWTLESNFTPVVEEVFVLENGKSHPLDYWELENGTFHREHLLHGPSTFYTDSNDNTLDCYRDDLEHTWSSQELQRDDNGKVRGLDLRLDGRQRPTDFAVARNQAGVPTKITQVTGRRKNIKLGFHPIKQT